MRKVFLVAVAEELNFAQEINGIPVVVCGVGKVNAAMGVFECIQKGYQEIINIGSCGSLNIPYGEIVKIGKVYQDIDARPICDYGLSPFEPEEPYLEIDRDSEYSCFSTDYFYDQHQAEKYSKAYLDSIKLRSVFDMECYAMAKASRKFEVKFSAYKWVSDDGDHAHWVENCIISFEHFKSFYF